MTTFFPVITPQAMAHPHIVQFTDSRPVTICWADSNGNSVCSRPGRGRLGLCSEHELVILGEPEKP